MIVVYEGDGEVIVCEKKSEKAVVKGFFGDNGGKNRNIEEYDRKEVGSYASFITRIKLDERETRE